MPRVPFTFWTLMNAIPVAVVATYALVAAGEYLANPPARPWDGALPFWGTLLIASTAAATWVLSSRRKSVASLSPTGAPPMPLSRVRFTVRRLMVAVAVAGLLMLVAFRVAPTARLFLYHAAWQRDFDETLDGVFMAKAASEPLDTWESWLMQRRDYHARRKSAYLRSLVRFWEPLPVDPRPPARVPKPKHSHPFIIAPDPPEPE